ncbi:MAG: C39 family peptidase [Chloroflexota bacterium]
MSLVLLSACGPVAPLPGATATDTASTPLPASREASATIVAADVPKEGPVSGTSKPAESRAESPVASPTASTAQPLAATATPRPAEPTATSAPTSAPKAAVQGTTRSWTEGAADFPRGHATGLEMVGGEGARLASRDGGYATTGELLSEVRESGFPFDNVVLSWNGDAQEGTSLRFELRARQGESWSSWYALGEWRKEGGRSIAGQSDGGGRVDIDTLKLSSPATALQYRVKFTGSGSSSPLLRRVSVAYSDLRRGLAGPALERPAAAARDLDVPRHSQLEEAAAVATKICSPTSLAMVMQYWGFKGSVAEVYAGVRDQTTGIYGNWPLNAAYAGANGFEARVDRFYAVEQLEQEIAAGRPVIISVAYGAGELTGAATSSTDGHLIVVRGFTQGGDVIVNDPIAPNSQSVRLVYKRGELGRIWLRSGGIVYLVAPRS